TSMAKLIESAFQADVCSPNRIKVRVAKLDTLVSVGEIPPPGIIKLDVEGAELLVLDGATKVLTQFRPIIFAEIHSPTLLAGCENRLKALGYVLFGLRGQRIDLSKVEADVMQIFAFHRM